MSIIEPQTAPARVAPEPAQWWPPSGEQPLGPPTGPPVDPPMAESASERAGTDARFGWERPALIAVLAVTAVLYLWDLGASGWANSFYSAAAQAGSQSWKAWFFGSSDAASSITVDKPPASLWVMGLSVRLFGLSSWSLLVPQALMGVGTVAVVHRTVRRWFSAHAALLAAIVMATTPVAALMFRFNNPDALLVLLMALAAHTVLRGIEDGRRRWIVLAGVAIGFGFLTKQLQVLLIVPPLALAYLIAAPPSARRRVTDLLAGGAAMVAASGWWLAIVTLVPASMRPYIGGSQNNSILELTLGYNGFGRLTGDETGSVGGGGGGNAGGMWGQTGITRMFDGVMGGQIAWLLPAAVVFLAVALWVTRGRPRTDRTRAAVMVWGGWLIVTALVFSFMQGIFHEYYTVALAPAIAVMIGIGADLLWRRRGHWLGRATLTGVVVVTVVWSAALLNRAPSFASWLRPTIVAAGVAAAVLLMIAPHVHVADLGRSRLAIAGAITAVIACLAGPTAWALGTASTPHTGSIVTAGPTVAGTGFGPGGGGRGGFPNGGPRTGTPPAGNGNTPPNGGGAFPNGGGAFPAGGQRPGGGGTGGLLDSADVSDDVVTTLLQDADQYTWVAAAVGSNRAAGFQLASEQPVMPIGGFNGSDPSPTLAEFQQYVANGQIHYFIAGGGFGQSMGGSSASTAIETWVTNTFTATTVDGVTLYDLTTGAS